MTRHPDWRLRLNAYLAGIGTPFAYGGHDCALFAAGAVHAMTGEDLSQGLAGRYDGLKSGIVQLKAKGFADHVAVVEAHLAEVAPAMAKVGDVVALSHEDGIVPLGILLGEVAACLTPTGAVGFVPRSAVMRAFEVA